MCGHFGLRCIHLHAKAALVSGAASILMNAMQALQAQKKPAAMDRLSKLGTATRGAAGLDRYGCLDGRMVFVAGHFKVFVRVVEDAVRPAQDAQRRIGKRCAR